jgi:hypothetical protein
MSGVSQYLNRHWIPREYDSGRRDVYEIFTVSRHDSFFFFSIIDLININLDGSGNLAVDIFYTTQ